MPQNSLPTATLSEKELRDIKSLEEKLRITHPGNNIVLIAYQGK